MNSKVLCAYLVAAQATCAVAAFAPAPLQAKRIAHSRFTTPRPQSYASFPRTVQALSVDASTVDTALDYFLLNFRIVKALLPAPVAGAVADTPTGILTQLVGALGVLTYLTTPPNVLGGLLDYAGGLSGAGAPWEPADISKLGRALGKGTYGTAYEAVPTEVGAKKLKAGGRDSGGRMVVKKLVDVSQAEIEAYFNRRVSRAGGGGYFASFLGGSQPSVVAADAGLDARGAAGGGRAAALDPRLLVWDYEGSCTLETFMADPLFPLNLEAYFTKRGQNPETLGVKDPPGRGERGDGRREAEMLRRAMADVLRATKALHNLGIVHRDIKPANILVAETPRGQVLRLIDLGACADLRNGFNYEPESGILDPRYGPPEQYIMPQTTPRPPPGILALLAAPFLWQTQSPDLFDSYTVGMTLLQMAVPELRSIGGTKNANQQLRSCDNDAQVWRERYGQRLTFDLLDRQNGAGWDLVCKLLTSKRRRLSVSGALSHRFFRPDGLSSVGLQPAGSSTLTRAEAPSRSVGARPRR